MSRSRGLLALAGFVLFVIISSHGMARAGGKDTSKPTKVAGLLIGKGADWMTVKADGEDEPVKYQIPASNKALAKALKGIFNAARVQLTYKMDGDARQVVTCKKQVLALQGVVTGKVVKVYDNFWVEVKPKNAVSDGYAPGANFKNKAFMDKLKSLQPGDSVTIKFYTDFERHRILELKKN